MAKFRSILVASVAAIGLAACGADDVESPGASGIVINNPPPTTPPPGNGGGGGTGIQPAADCPAGTNNAGTVTLSDARGSVRNCRFGQNTLTEDLRLPNQAGTVYSFQGRTDVGIDVGGDGNAAAGDAAVLTIEPGVVVMAETRESFLVVNRGSRLEAEGNENNPIIFTSRDNVVGATAEADASEWGGILLLGRAPIADCDSAAGTSTIGGTANCNQFAEGVTGNRPIFGGDQVDDDSGSIRYVQIRFSGVGADGDELQGLTTGGVGRDTEVSYLHVHNSDDDGIEIFGGTHNADHLVFTGIRDDSVDTDSGYRGAIQFVIAARRPGGDETSSPTVAEIDSGGDEGNLPRQYLRLANFTFVSDADYRAITLRGGADAAFLNGVVVNSNPNGSCLFIDDDASNNSGPDAASEDIGQAVFSSVVFDCATDFTASGGAFTASIFNAGSNNEAGSYQNTLSAIVSGVEVVNGANENAVTPVANIAQYHDDPYGEDLDAGTLEQVDYIGAVRDASDDWYQGWTCDSAVIDFGSNQNCLVVPFN